jgi:hypothetical protein
LDKLRLKIADEQMLMIDIATVETAATAATVAASAVAVAHVRANTTAAATSQFPAGPHPCVTLSILSFEDQHHLFKKMNNKENKII